MSKTDPTDREWTAPDKAQAAGRLCRKGSPLARDHAWCQLKTRALVKNRTGDLVEITIMEWSNSGEKAKLRFHASGHTRWVDVTQGEYVLEEMLGKPPVDIIEHAPAKRLKDAKQWEIAAAMVALALEDEKEGRVVRSHGDHLILAEVHKFFQVPEDVRVKAMVEADDSEAGYERCRHMLKAAFAVET